MVRVASLPEYITATFSCRFKGFENIKNFDYLIQKFNEARDEYFKFVLEEGGYKELVRKKTGINLTRYELYKKVDDKLIAGYTCNEIYGIIQDKAFAQTISMLILWTLKGLNALKDKLKELGYRKEAESIPTEFEIEFNYWNFIACIGTSERGYKGNRKIKLRPDGKTIDILNPFDRDISGIFKFRGKFGKIFKIIFENEIWKDKLGYFAKVVRVSENWKNETLYCKVHISVPIDYYLYYGGHHVFQPNIWFGIASGSDVNTDRINTTIVRVKDLKLLDYKTFWFDEVNAKNFSRKKAWEIISSKLHEMFRWVKQKGSRFHVFEDYELIGQWKLINSLRGEKLKNSESNWRLTTFRNSVIEKAVLIAIRENFPIPILINPSETTQIAKELAPMLGLDIHTTSAYVITCLGILETINEINN